MFQKIRYFTSNISTHGLVIGYLRLPSTLIKNPLSLLIGCGPSNYYTPVYNYYSMSTTERYFGNTVLTLQYGQLGDWRVSFSLVTPILGKLGPLRFIFFIIIFKSIFSFLLSLFKNVTLDQLKWQIIGLILYFTFIVLMAIESPWAGYTIITLTWPLFVMLGIFYSNFYGKTQSVYNILKNRNSGVIKDDKNN